MLAVLVSDIFVTKDPGSIFNGDSEKECECESADPAEKASGCPVAYASISCNASKASPLRRNVDSVGASQRGEQMRQMGRNAPAIMISTSA